MTGNAAVDRIRTFVDWLITKTIHAGKTLASKHKLYSNIWPYPVNLWANITDFHNLHRA